jgi:glycosyltransferase involved in cell wall biosynthesis
MQPKISVVIPSFNRGHIIKETLDSVLHQTYNHWECLVVDDGSTDNTEEVVKSYSQGDVRIKFFKRPKERTKGASTCRNIGIEESTGGYFQFLDSDDLLEKNKFEIQIKELSLASENSIATCKWGIVGLNKKNAKLYHCLPTYFSYLQPVDLITTYGKSLTFLPCHVFLVPRAVIAQSGKWDEELIINQDGEFFSRIILASSKVVFCENTYVLYRTGAGERITSSQKAEKGRKGYIKSLELIDRNIQKSTGNRIDHIYIKQRKAELYYKLKTENLALIENNGNFFKGKSSPIKYYLLKLISGVKIRISKKVEIIDFSLGEE